MGTIRVGVTGANGYIGSTLVRELSATYTVVPITRDDVDLLDAVEVRQYFSNNKFDMLIHTAIKGGSRLKVETYSDLDQNLKMYYNLLDNKNSFSKFISIGSGAELYATDTPYGLSKYVIRRSMLDKDNFYNIRVFAVFDENELDTRFIKANIVRYIKRKPIVIHQDKKMDFFYMKDFVEVIKYYIEETTPPKEFDCTYNNTYYLSEIAEKINNLSNYKVPIKVELETHAKPYMGISTNKITYIGLDSALTHIHKQLCKTLVL